MPNDLQLWRLLKGREVESGLGEEAFQEAGPVLHPLEAGLHQRGQLADVVLGEVGQRSFQVRPGSAPARKPAAGRPSARSGL